MVEDRERICYYALGGASVIHDLTVSRIDRQNILNNELAMEEVRQAVDMRCVYWNDAFYVTKELVAAYFDVDVRTIERYIGNFRAELKCNGMEILKGDRLESFIAAYNVTFATDINVGRKMRSITVFDFSRLLEHCYASF